MESNIDFLSSRMISGRLVFSCCSRLSCSSPTGTHMHRNARKKFCYFNKFFQFSLHCPYTRTCCADGKKVIICVSKNILPSLYVVLRTCVIYFLYLYIYFWQILCWPFFCVTRTCEGKLCGGFICFRISE